MSMTSRSADPQRVAPPRRPLSTGECRDWLTTHREGRLAYLSGRGPRSVVVSYALAEQQIVFRLPDYNDIVHYAPGERVTLEVEGMRPAEGDFETVSVTGRAELATGEDQARLPAADFEEEWPDDVCTRVLCLPMTEVSGFERPLRHRVPAR